MQAGKLNRRVTLQRPTVIKDELGGEKPDWADFARVWANIRYMSGKEFTKNGLDSSSSTVSVMVRRNGLSLKMDANCRILFGNKIFNITAVLPDEQYRESITFACSEGLNEGK